MWIEITKYNLINLDTVSFIAAVDNEECDEYGIYLGFIDGKRQSILYDSKDTMEEAYKKIKEATFNDI